MNQPVVGYADNSSAAILRRLTSSELQGLVTAPTAVEWFANLVKGVSILQDGGILVWQGGALVCLLHRQSRLPLWPLH